MINKISPDDQNDAAFCGNGSFKLFHNFVIFGEGFIIIRQKSSKVAEIKQRRVIYSFSFDRNRLRIIMRIN